MTTPPQQTQTQTQPPPQQPNVALVAAVGVILAAQLLPSFALPALIPLLIPDRNRSGISALRVALATTEAFPEPSLQGVGAAQAEMIRMNELRRAAYVVNSMLRLRTAIEDARAQGSSLIEAEKAVRTDEAVYFRQHVQAAGQRMAAASKIDALAIQYGPILGWYAAKDKRVTAECRNANGNNFSALDPPAIGWPGVVHMNCRCQPGPPHRRGRMLS
jgi:SPP1 gp7 family putative phage head morphogenesis protein